HDCVHPPLLPMLSMHQQITFVLLFKLNDFSVEMELHSLSRQLFAEHPTYILIETFQECVTPMTQMGFNSEAIKDTGELHSNIPAANNQNFFRQRFKKERLV